MTLRYNIKHQARLALQGCWGRARMVLLVMLALVFCINILDAAVIRLLGYEFLFSSYEIFSYSENFFFDPIAIFLNVAISGIRLIILAPLGVGMVAWYRRLSDRELLGASHVFCVYEDRTWLRAAWLSICVWARIILVGLPLFVLPVFLIMQAVFYVWSPVLALVMECLGWLLLVVAAAVVMVFAKRYQMSSMLLGEHYRMTVREAIKTSVRCTRGHCVQLFALDLSFIPKLLPLIAVLVACYASVTVAYDPFSLLPPLLLLASLIIAGFTLFMVQPHYSMTQLMFSRYLYERETRKQAGPETQPAAQWDDIEQPTEQEEPPAQPAQEDGAVCWQDIPD